MGLFRLRNAVSLAEVYISNPNRANRPRGKSICFMTCFAFNISQMKQFMQFSSVEVGCDGRLIFLMLLFCIMNLINTYAEDVLILISPK